MTSHLALQVEADICTDCGRPIEVTKGSQWIGQFQCIACYQVRNTRKEATQ